MINFNGQLRPSEDTFLNHNNRGLRYGDALFESLRVVNGKLFFWEDHYLRLMASMRMLRMEIPMSFTLDFLAEEIQQTLEANHLNHKAARVRITVFRVDGGLYLPQHREVDYIIETHPLEMPFYTLNEAPYEVELYKDFWVNPDLLSTLKTNNKLVHVLGSIFAAENKYDNCLLLNTAKEVVEALQGNLFLVSGTTLKTPPLQSGCLNGIVRKKLIGIVQKLEDYELLETPISPFELQKADELFITNAIVGIQPITKYRKKEFANTVAKALVGKLNAVARLEA